MYGAIIGDIIGSGYKYKFVKTQKFPLFTPASDFSENSVMMLSVARGILDQREYGEALPEAIRNNTRLLKRRYAGKAATLSEKLGRWFHTASGDPDNRCINNSAVWFSSCGLFATSLEETLELAEICTVADNGSDEAVKAAQAVAAAVFLAKVGSTKQCIRNFIHENFYSLERSAEEIQASYRTGKKDQNCVPSAVTAFLESRDFEDAVRRAVLMGGETDIMASITGAIAWSYYRSHQAKTNHSDLESLCERAKKILPKVFLKTIDAVENQSQSVFQKPIPMLLLCDACDYMTGEEGPYLPEAYGPMPPLLITAEDFKNITA